MRIINRIMAAIKGLTNSDRSSSHKSWTSKSLWWARTRPRSWRRSDWKGSGPLTLPTRSHITTPVTECKPMTFKDSKCTCNAKTQAKTAGNRTSSPVSRLKTRSRSDAGTSPTAKRGRMSAPTNTRPKSASSSPNAHSATNVCIFTQRLCASLQTLATGWTARISTQNIGSKWCHSWWCNKCKCQWCLANSKKTTSSDKLHNTRSLCFSL